MTTSIGRRVASGFARSLPIQLGLLLLVVLLPVPTAPALAESSPTPAGPYATVVGTNTLYLRACPVLTCRVITSIPLGAEVDIVGEMVDGFAPVRWQEYEGWAYTLFLSSHASSPELVRSGVPGCQRIALIFNAGIGEEPSEEILETLVTTQTPVTVFAMGWWADTYPGYLHRLVTGANAVIGTHGHTQLFLTEASDEQIVAEIHNSAEAIREVTGYEPARYYTPYATDSDQRVERIIAGEGYLPVGWTIAAADYNHDDSAGEIYDRVMGGVHDGAIVELHLDGPATDQSTALALPSIIRDLEARGYQLVTVPEILLPCPSAP
ncbi:MAG TPA: polysaccharide deacetylase family protein [Thermomicrobiales bacterium]|nr:polysaccharide deacetylase family protein [Thermomicrobiales bacterium]